MRLWFFRIGIFLIALLAVLFRIQGFIDIPDLYGDEVSLAFNLYNKSVLGYFGRLDIDQACPPFFLVLTRVFASFIPDFEYSLRLMPFLASLLSVFAFLFLILKAFKRKIAIITAFSLFLFVPKVLIYGCVFKQYSSDILLFISVLISYFYLDFNKKDFKFYTIIFLYGVLIWFSYPVIFAASAVFFVKIVEKFIESKNLKETAINFLSLTPFFISFILFYIFQGQLNSNGSLHKYWEMGFLKYNFSNIFDIFVMNFKYFFPDFSLIALIFFILGLVFVFKNIKQGGEGKISGFNFLLAVLFVLTILMSYLHIYPFSMRVSLYFVSVLVLIISSFFEYFDFNKTFLRKAFAVVFAGLFIILSIFFTLRSKVYKTAYIERIETVMMQAKNIMNERKNPDRDILYVADGSRAAAKFYIERRPNVYDFKNVHYENFPDIGKLSIEEYIKRLQNHTDKDFKKGTTFYYVFTHYPKKQDMLNALYLFSKDKKDFRIYTDNNTFDALIIFSN